MSGARSQEITRRYVLAVSWFFRVFAVISLLCSVPPLVSGELLPAVFSALFGALLGLWGWCLRSPPIVKEAAGEKIVLEVKRVPLEIEYATIRSAVRLTRYSIKGMYLIWLSTTRQGEGRKSVLLINNPTVDLRDGLERAGVRMINF